MKHTPTPAKQGLLPCPFCGSLPTIIPWHGGKKTKKLIECSDDKCLVGPSVTGETREEAIGYWNACAGIENPETIKELIEAASELLNIAAIWQIDPDKSQKTLNVGFKSLRDALTKLKEEK